MAASESYLYCSPIRFSIPSVRHEKLCICFSHGETVVFTCSSAGPSHAFDLCFIAFNRDVAYISHARSVGEKHLGQNGFQWAHVHVDALERRDKPTPPSRSAPNMFNRCIMPLSFQISLSLARSPLEEEADGVDRATAQPTDT